MISGSSVASMLNLSPSVVSKLASKERKDSCREKIENDIFDLNTYENKGGNPNILEGKIAHMSIFHQRPPNHKSICQPFTNVPQIWKGRLLICQPFTNVPQISQILERFIQWLDRRLEETSQMLTKPLTVMA